MIEMHVASLSSGQTRLRIAFATQLWRVIRYILLTTYLQTVSMGNKANELYGGDDDDDVIFFMPETVRDMHI